MIRVTRVLALVLAAAVLAPPAAAVELDGRVVDLTHPFEAGVLTWPSNRPFVLEKDHDGMTAGGYYYAANSFCMAEHTGTHVDAPLHFHRGGAAVDALALERLIAPALVVDVSAAAAADRDYLIGLDDLGAWEARHGRVPAGAIVLFRTGFGGRWPDKERYAGTAETGAAAVAKLHFPGLDPRGAAWLAERAVGAVGLDTPSIDHGPSTDFASHVVLARAGIPVLENLANLDQLPARGATVVALPMKLKGGSGAPLRVVAIVPPAVDEGEPAR